MSAPVLVTKLYAPPPRPQAVPRQRLIDQMNEGLHRKLTLISAPAGFGKTTLVSEWLANRDPRSSWLSLDEEDNDPTRFLTYFIAALQSIDESLGIDVLNALRSPQPPPTESILTALLNEVAATEEDFIIVLDDYHRIDSSQVDNILGFLTDYLPPQMHLVITTRQDPSLPLARLRARGQMTELRATDLRFTVEEATQFLNTVMGFNLSTEDIAALETRTEGWIAGLQLAALSLQGREDIHGFISAFAGDNRYIVDYLVDEVLEHQPEHVRNFLLQTSVLDRLSGQLCDAVTGQEDGALLLESLERSNLFVIPLDDKREWFRYHHLFADVLYAHLLEEQPRLLPTLHLLASEWSEHNDLPSEAIRHALAAEDFERAAGLLELTWSEMDRNRQSYTWLGWAKTLPDETIRARPLLCVGCAWALLDSGELESGEAYLRAAERLLDATKSIEMIGTDENNISYLRAIIASARAYYAMAFGDISGTVKNAQQALDLLPIDNHIERGIAASLLGMAYWAIGSLAEAAQALIDGMSSFQRAGNLILAITGTFVIADIRRTQGQLREAFDTYHQSLKLVEGQGELVQRGTAETHTGLSELYCERYMLEDAKEHLAKSKELGENSGLPHWQYRWCIAHARIKEMEGNLDNALNLLDEADRLYIRGPVPDVRPIAALKAQVWVAQGRETEALHWAQEQGLSIEDDTSYLHEFEYITLARVLLAANKSDPASYPVDGTIGLLERLLKAAEDGSRMGNAIEILTLLALAHQRDNNESLALEALGQALALAAPEGYIRSFVDKGTSLLLLLSEASARGIMPDYARRLLTLVTMDEQDDNAYPIEQPLIEPLSERELEVLHLIAEGLSNREIAERLFIALPTVKGHNQVIYGKLQVQRRTEAVARARELGLL